ncbi:MAG: hypothetical protein K0S71_568 [Clostridia bacterium]|jgi:hypothetical protein|nr:hypothetical protein [Clostridia bacterium]
MIKEVMKAINGQLKQSFPTITIQSTDVSEGYKRPCFYVDLVSYDHENIMNAFDRKAAAITVYYFPSDPKNNKIELLEVREAMQTAFDGMLQITPTFTIHIMDTESTVNDGVLSFDFNIEYFIKKQEPESTYYIEEIETNL